MTDRIGYGALGLRDELPDYELLTLHSASRKDVLVDVRPVQEVTGWALDQSNTYEAPYELNDLRGFREDVIGVKSLLDAGLSRVETLTTCRSTSGSFFYDVDETFNQAVTSWDDAAGYWQLDSTVFDGDDAFVSTSQPSGVTDSNYVTFSIWFRIDDGDGTTRTMFDCGDGRFIVALNTSNKITVQGRNAAGTLILSAASDTAILADSSWHHLLFSCDIDDAVAANNTVLLYVDNADDLAASPTKNQGPIDFTRNGYSVGAEYAGTRTNFWNGGLSYLWLADEFFTIGQERDREYFITDDDKPEDLGVFGQVPLDPDGETDLEEKPILFFRDGGTDFAINKGEDDDFELSTTDGSPTFDTKSPPDDAQHLQWDQFPILYAHLEDDSDPDDTSVVAIHEVQYASRGQTQPALGDDKLVDGDLDEWHDIYQLDDWTDGNPGHGPQLTRSSTVRGEGTYSASFVWDGTEQDGNNDIRPSANVAMVAGKRYRLSGFYRVDWLEGHTKPVVKVRMTYNDGSDKSVTEDGRHISTSDASLTLDCDESGQWMRWMFDFIAPYATMKPVLETTGTAGTTKGTVYFDGVKLQRINRFYYHEPRVSGESLPEIQTGSNDIFFGGKRISSGSVSFNGADGGLDQIFGRLEWMNQECIVRVGGALLYADTEVPLMKDDFERRFTGLIQRIDNDDNETALELLDLRTFFHIDLPKRLYDDTVTPNQNTAIQGKARPVFWGVKENISPNRINLSSDYGVYELADCQEAANGIKAIDQIFAYASETYATERNPSKRILLTLHSDYDADLDNGQFTIIHDVGPYEIVSGSNDIMDWNVGAGTLETIFTPGVYTAADLAAEIEHEMEDTSGATDITVSYSDSTHKFTIAKGAGTLQILKSGDNRQRTIYSLIGFTSPDDLTGSLSYAGDEATFSSDDVDRKHVLRVDAQGYRDDASGTYTGTANALIETGSDICRYVFHRLMNKSASLVDETSFQFARGRAAQSLAIYLNETTSTKDLFDRLEYSNIANIIVDGEGRIYYRVYVGDVPSNIVDLSDSDFADFATERSVSDIYRAIRVQFDQDPSLKTWRARESTDNSVQVRLGRPDIREFPTYLKIADNAVSVSARMLELASTAARKIRGTVANPKLIRREVGDKVRITRSRAMGLKGNLSNDIFRILSISKQPLTGECTFEATDDRVTVASNACIVSCQSFCESTCQLLCEQACQETCELNCQTTCEVTCQEVCQSACQEVCQLECQTACESACQATCQQSCQTGCEASGCQTACEAGCQTTCQLTCQDACESACQSPCEATCQTQCQTACQATCELACQTTCELACQDACELNCQDLCETSCQTFCESNCQFFDEK